MREVILEKYEALVNSNYPDIDEIYEYFLFFNSSYIKGDRYVQVRTMEALTYLLRLIHSMLGEKSRELIKKPELSVKIEQEKDELAMRFIEILRWVVATYLDETDEQVLRTFFIFTKTYRTTIGIDYFGLNYQFTLANGELYSKNPVYAGLYK